MPVPTSISRPLDRAFAHDFGVAPDVVRRRRVCASAPDSEPPGLVLVSLCSIASNTVTMSAGRFSRISLPMGDRCAMCVAV